VYPYTFKEDLDNGLGCDNLLRRSHNGYLGELINNHEYIVIYMLGGGET
jgi:hypothetical protein